MENHQQQQNDAPPTNGSRNTNERNRFYIESRRIPASELANQIADPNPRFGVVRDRLFHAMLVRISLPYHTNFPKLVRQFIEFATLVNALTLLMALIYIHFLVANYPAQCLDHVKENWPRKGIVRVEVIRNLEEFREMQLRKENVSSNTPSCQFNLVEILRQGRLPAEFRSHRNKVAQLEDLITQNPLRTRRRAAGGRSMPNLVDAFFWLSDQMHRIRLNVEEEKESLQLTNGNGIQDDEEMEDENKFSEDEDFTDEQIPFYHHLFEFSLHYGLLRLSAEMRQSLNVETLVVQLDAEKDACFRHWRQQPLMRYLIGLDELVMVAVKQLSENETERGYLRDFVGGELYHFITVGQHSTSHYFTALLVMLIFTFAISMLLRFSHDQIFVFIVDLFQMFEQNQPLIFPIAPLLTVILALVGMEAIMSEIFNDTSTAFYVILLVWVADQYDAIFCHSSIGRRYWLRFFYLQHLGFYWYNAKYTGSYNGLALLTSAAFTLHSMVFFYHHYELPHILYHENLVNTVQHLQNTEAGDGTVDVMRIRIIDASRGRNNNSTNNSELPTVGGESRIRIGNLQDSSLRAALSTILGRRLSRVISAEVQRQNGQEAGVQQQQRISADQQVDARSASEITGASAEEVVAQGVVENAFREAEQFLASRRETAEASREDQRRVTG